MNAPEKLYLLPNGLISFCRNTDEDIEYTLAYTFIAKVERFLEYNLNDRVEIRVAGTLIPSLTDKKTFIEDLKNYMKGE